MAGRRLGRWTMLGGGVLLALLSWFVLPLGLRRVGFFTVRRIEIVGARHLPSDTILAVLDLEPGANVFDPHAAAERRLAALPGVTKVRVGRRLPGTLRIQVRESVPVALVPGENQLELVDAQARVLPFDPSRGAPDLPVMAEADSVVARVLALVREVDGELFARVSAGRWQGRAILLDLGSWQLRVGPDVTAEVVDAVLEVERLLAERGWSYRELDARFRGQIVVRGRAA